MINFKSLEAQVKNERRHVGPGSGSLELKHVQEMWGGGGDMIDRGAEKRVQTGHDVNKNIFILIIGCREGGDGQKPC